MRHTFLLPSLNKKNCFQFYIKFEFKTAFSKKKVLFERKKIYSGFHFCFTSGFTFERKSTGFIESRLSFLVSLLKEKKYWFY